jgi:hypothetical protein
LFPDIKPKEASLKLEIPYTKSFCNSFYLMKKTPLNTTKVPKSIPPQNTPQETSTTDKLESIENPVAYTTSHIFKRMVDTGDYRWAQLFVQVLEKTNKLDYETIREQEWLNQASNMSMKDLVEKVAKKESISRSTLRRLDDLADTSPYENI